jgi:SAM-dependent methyltransferase
MRFMPRRRDDSHDVLEHYLLAEERDRLDSPLGQVEFERTREILDRHLPPPPAVVADIGGGPGRYALWLAETGHRVLHRDLVSLHIEQLAAEAAERGLDVETAVADARSLGLPDASVDAVLLLGPMYHLTQRPDRLRALGEARRILRPGGMGFVAAISRWAPRLHGGVAQRLDLEFEGFAEAVALVERTGRMPPIFPGSFAGYCHRPGQLRSEIASAGFDVLDLVAVEGLAFALPDLEERMADPGGRAVILDAARALEHVPELLGLGPHLLATARRPSTG